MEAYTVDSVALIHYLLDILPERADDLFARAEAGDVTLVVPSIVLSETLYILAKRDRVRDIPIEMEPVQIIDEIEAHAPLNLLDLEYDALRVLADLLEDLTLHDAMIVASHRANETEAIITTDSEITDAEVLTVWG